FTGKDVAAVLYQVVHGDPPPLAEQAPDLPADVELVLRRVLAKRPFDRFATMAAFARALAVAAQPAEVTTRVDSVSIPVSFQTPPPTRNPLTRWMQRRRVSRPAARRPGLVARTMALGREAWDDLRPARA